MFQWLMLVLILLSYILLLNILHFFSKWKGKELNLLDAIRSEELGKVCLHLPPLVPCWPRSRLALRAALRDTLGSAVPVNKR